MKDLLRFTINVQTPTVNFSAVCISCAKMECCSSEMILTFLYAGSSIQNAREQCVSCINSFFYNLPPSYSPPNKNLAELGLEIQTALSGQPFRIRHTFVWGLFPTMTDTVTSQNNDLTFWITLCNEAVTVYCQTN